MHNTQLADALARRLPHSPYQLRAGAENAPYQSWRMLELKNRAEAQLNSRKEEENQILDGERPHPRKKKRLTRI